LVTLLDGDAERGGIADAVAAEVATDTGFHGAEALAVRIARRHVQIRPHGRQVFLAHTEQVDALPAGELDHRNGVLVGDLGDAAQLPRIGHAALHLRYHREGAVTLNVGVHPVVDESGVLFVDELVGPHHLQQRRQRHLGVGVLAAIRCERGEHR
jgi:hypothetical protein